MKSLSGLSLGSLPIGLVLLWLSFSLCAAEPVAIGVLAKRGPQIALSRWQATATYLTQQLPDYRFEIVPLDFNEIDAAVQHGKIDFILANSSIYVTLEKEYGVTPVVTMKNRVGDSSHSEFAGVLFARADLKHFQRLQDIRGRRLAAVDATSLGGFQMAWREMLAAGIDPYRDTAELLFAGTHDAVVHAVLNGAADVGTVRSDTLERMAQEGKIHLDRLKVLPHPADAHKLELLHSTRNYPEWPLAMLRHTPLTLAEAVATTLIKMPADSQAARLSNTSGWTIPLNYGAVHALLEELQLPPYQPQPISLQQLLNQHWSIISLICAGLIVTSLLSARLSHANRRLRHAQGDLERRVQERTQALHAREQELETLIDNLPSMVFVKDARDLSYLRVNKAGEELLGCRREELIGQTVHALMPHDQAELFERQDREVLATGKTADIPEEPLQTPQGTRYLHTRLVCIKDQDGQAKFLLGIANDITERKVTMDKLDHLATHDPLTGLYNRRVLEERLVDEMNRVERYHDALSVFMLDIDHFKHVNDTYGHRDGDKVLQQLARAIEDGIRRADYAARYGGEEFTVVLPVTPLSKAEEMAERLRQRIAALPFQRHDGDPLYITVSIGVAAVVDPKESWEHLLERADHALYRAKQQGRNQIQVEG